MRPKILHLVNQSTFGGTQQYILDLTNHQASMGQEIVIAAGETPDDNFIRAVAAIPQARFQQLNVVSSRLSPLRDLQSIFELRKLIAQHNPSIIHIHSPKLNLLTGIALHCSLLPVRCSLIYTVHGFWLNEPKRGIKYAIHYSLEWLGARFMDVVICVSRRDADDMTTTNITTNANVIHPALHPGRLTVPSREQSINQLQQLIPTTLVNKKIIGFVANLYPGKGSDVLIEAMRSITPNNCIAVIIGDGPHKQKNELQVTSYQLQDRIFFTGYLSNASNYMPAFDVLTLPSDKEGLPVVLLEAAAAGTPVVATSVGGVPEIKEMVRQAHHDKVNWILVPPHDSVALAKALINALSLPRLPAKTQEQLQGEFDEFLTRTDEVYNRVLSDL